MHDTLSNRSHIQYEPYSELQKTELTRKLRLYIENESEEPEVINLRQIKEILSVFRLLYKNLDGENAAERSKSRFEGSTLDSREVAGVYFLNLTTATAKINFGQHRCGRARRRGRGRGGIRIWSWTCTIWKRSTKVCKHSTIKASTKRQEAVLRSRRGFCRLMIV